MKLWLPGLALLAASSSVWADNYRIVQSNTLKLDVWVDNIKDNTPQSWCGPELPLRIVSSGDKTPKVLDNFMPRLGSLLESQCSKLKTVRWQLNDAQGKALANGTATKSGDWNPADPGRHDRRRDADHRRYAAAGPPGRSLAACRPHAVARI